MLFLLILISGLSWNRHYSPRSGKSDGNFSLSVHIHRVGPPDIPGGAAGQVRFFITFFVGHLTFYIQQAASLVLSPSIRQSISPSPFIINSNLDCHIYGPSGLVWYVDLPVTGPEIIFPTDVTWYDNILTWRDLLNYWTCFNCVSIPGGTAEWKKSLVSNIKGMNKRNIINVIELKLTWWHTHTHTHSSHDARYPRFAHQQVSHQLTECGPCPVRSWLAPCHQFTECPGHRRGGWHRRDWTDRVKVVTTVVLRLMLPTWHCVEISLGLVVHPLEEGGPEAPRQRDVRGSVLGSL